ncbi:hypothetical protein CPB85DRAFT_1310756 [Mucidula mucida]|nr:hypothetical protein CPB85DRAFT_1310756 [Mucidula mucida]
MLKSARTFRYAGSTCARRRTAHTVASSGLGIRNNVDLPPDMTNPPNRDPEDISDNEWELRTGRAVDLIQKTLPDFFHTGLITSVEKATGDPCTSSPIPIPVVNTNPLGRHPELEPIYSPKVRLSYQLPAPFPKTLHIEGFPMYIASSAFARHTLNALYSDLHLVLQKVALEDPRVSGTGEPSPESKRRREKSLTVVFSVHGNARVSGAEGRWDVHSSYTFSPLSGLIYVHTINSILPAPHQAVFDGLRASLGNVFGSPKQPGDAGAACKEQTDD